MAEKVGIYVCHCGSNIAGMVDVEEVAKWAGKTIPNVAVSRDYKFMCSSLGSADDPGRHQEGRVDARGRGRLLAALARENLPPRLRERTPQSVSLPDDESPRALLVGEYRQAGGHGEGQGPGLRRGPARQRATAAPTDVRRREPGHAGHWRRHRRPASDARTGRRRPQSLPRRAHPERRRAHGPVRQDLPHARLFGLHPHAQDVRGRPARERHVADLLRVGRGERLGGALQGQNPQEVAAHHLREMHGLRHLRRKMPTQDRR